MATYWRDIPYGTDVVRKGNTYFVNKDFVYWDRNDKEATVALDKMTITTLIRNTKLKCHQCGREVKRCDTYRWHPWFHKPLCSEECYAALFRKCEDCGYSSLTRRCEICANYKPVVNLEFVTFATKEGSKTTWYESAVSNPACNEVWAIIGGCDINVPSVPVYSRMQYVMRSHYYFAVRVRKLEEHNPDKCPHIVVHRRYYKDFIVQPVRGPLRRNGRDLWLYHTNETIYPAASSLASAIGRLVDET